MEACLSMPVSVSGEQSRVRESAARGGWLERGDATEGRRDAHRATNVRAHPKRGGVGAEQDKTGRDKTEDPRRDRTATAGTQWHVSQGGRDLGRRHHKSVLGAQCMNGVP